MNIPQSTIEPFGVLTFPTLKPIKKPLTTSIDWDYVDVSIVYAPVDTGYAMDIRYESDQRGDFMEHSDGHNAS